MIAAPRTRLAALVLTICFAQGIHAAPPQNIAYVTNQGEGLTLVDLTTMKTLGSIAVGSDPRGLAVTPDGRYVLTANQGSGDLAVVDTETREVVRRIAVGPNVEFMRILPDGSRAFVTYEPSSKQEAPAKGGKDDDAGPATPAEIAIIDLKSWSIIGRMKAAPETEGVEFSPDHSQLIVANEGSNTITVYDIASRQMVKSIDVSHYGSRPRGVKSMPDSHGYIVTLENSNNFLVLDGQFNIIKAVPTARGPYGVAFDPSGQRLWIAASRDSQMQVFDAQTYSLVGTVAVGKRCWHFGFVDGGKELLLACGRSNALQLIDAKSMEVRQVLEGFKLPWGVVTFPKSFGSLDAP